MMAELTGMVAFLDDARRGCAFAGVVKGVVACFFDMYPLEMSSGEVLEDAVDLDA